MSLCERMRKITDNIIAETTFHGCNPSSIKTEEGLILVDTPYLPTDALKWKKELKRLGRIKYIINTEHHPDHVVGNFFFEGTVVSHQGTKENFGAGLKKMEGVWDRIRELDPKGIRFLKQYLPKEPRITFDHKLTLHAGNQTLELINLPGHTPNQIAVFMPEEKVIFTGDNVVYKTRPFYHDCKPNDWIESLKYLKKMDFNILIPGHGEVCDKEAINEMISYHNQIFEQIREAIERGLGKEETAEKVIFDERMPLMEYQKNYGPILDRMGVFHIYEELMLVGVS